ncbi:MAG TPA: arginyltransferase [Sediminispirochaeta sp.]|nr:arginyltransferase [Sediminispirochaeta sp.]
MHILGAPIGTVEIDCPYLVGRKFRSENVLIKEIDEAALDYLLALGYRHFGELYFRPVCEDCHQCIPLRIPVADFAASRGLRRVGRKAADLDVRIKKPVPSREKYRLYLRHSERFEEEQSGSYESFVDSFFSPSPFSRELLITRDSRLVAVSHLDVSSNSLSAVYCYWDPGEADLSLGSLSILKEIEYARSLGIRHLYLGFYVPGNSHMEYKVRFRPNEALLREGDWRRLYNATGELLNPRILERGFRPFTQLLSPTEGR